MINIPEEIKNLFNTEGINKNIRIHFPNVERADICNDMIIKDSVTLTESLCSQDTLKFGLCESPVFECSVVGCENVKGATIEVSCEIYCSQTVAGAEFKPDLQAYVYSIPYGTFIISECKRDADMQYRKIQAYNNAYTFKYIKNAFNKEKFNGFYPNDVPRLPMQQNFECFMYSEFPKTAFSNLSKTEIRPYQEKDVESYAFRIDARRQDYVYIRIHGEMYTTRSEAWAREPKRLIGFKNNNPKSADVLSSIFARCKNAIIEELESLGHYSESDIDNVSKEINSQKDKIISHFDNATIESWCGWDDEIGSIRVLTLDRNIDAIYPYSHNHPYINNDIRIYIPHRVESLINVREEPSMRTLYSESVHSDMKLFFFDTSQLSDDMFTISNTMIKSEGVYDNRVKFAKDVDLQKVIPDRIELMGKFGIINRFDIFDFINIKQKFGLTPSETMYPSSQLYPHAPTGGVIKPQDYQKIWYDDEYIKPFGKIIVTYKNTSNVDITYEYYLTGYDETSDANSYQVYDLANNEIIKGTTWTDAQIEEFCETIASNIEGVTYMPVEFTGRGLPYVEPGDTFEILTKSNDSITTIVLNRTLSGEQVLTDTYKSN